MDPAMWELYEDGDPEDELRVILRLSEGAEPPPEVRVVSHFGEIVTARMKRKDAPKIWYDERVESLKAPRKVWSPGAPGQLEPWSEADEEEPRALGPEPSMYPGAFGLREDGAGVVVGFCDWGFDFTHPNFRNDDGSTRMLSLWDQRRDRVFSRAEIDRALRSSDPCGALGYHPAVSDPGGTGAHGTHVADIAVGNRREPGSSVGLAPGADIVCVHLASDSFEELENLGDSVNLLEGLDFVCRTAAKRPCVASLSAGSVAGSHAGTSTVERAVDRLLEDGTLVLVQSVGNYADAATHTHARVGPNQRHTLDWIIPQGDRTPNEIELWYSGRDEFRVTLTAPGGQEFVTPLGSRLRVEIGGVHCGSFYHRKSEPNSGLNHIDVFLYPEAPSGEWQITLQGERVVDGRLHAWIERDGGGRHQSRFRREQATSLYTTNTICNSFFAIAVGAHDASQPDRPAARFSSRGPTADGRQKPEISAPGYRIRAARSMPRAGWNGEPKLCVKSGTSMAAPHVAGTVALMMQAAGRKLSIHEVRSILIGTADPGDGPRGRSSTRIGYGYLNVRAAVETARTFGAGSVAVAVPAAAPARQQPPVETEPRLDALASPASIEQARTEAYC
jgi:subtilisin family serine protease